MNFDQHHARIAEAAFVLTKAVEEAASDGITIKCELAQYSGYFLPKFTLSRDVATGSAERPFPKVK